MKCRIFVLSAFLLCFSFKSQAYTDVPSLVHLDIADQADSNGFNFVREFPSLVYSLINEGSIPLWESPEKRSQISGAALQAIEKSTSTRFEMVNHLFFHELWSSTRRKTSFLVLGFSFVVETKKGSRISYGFIDMKDVLPYLVNTQISCNVDGPASLTFLQAINSRRYNYQLVQFGKRDFKKRPEESLKIKKKAFNPKKKVVMLYVPPNNKSVYYMLEPDKNNPDDILNKVYSQVEAYLNSRREVFFYIGGSKYYDYKTYLSGLKVTGFEVNEIWSKNKLGIEYKINTVTIFVNNKKLDPITMDYFASFNLLFNFKTFEDILNEKKFKYTVSRINNLNLAPEESEAYMKALQNYSWRRVSYYVKYYNKSK